LIFIDEEFSLMSLSVKKSMLTSIFYFHHQNLTNNKRKASDYNDNESLYFCPVEKRNTTAVDSATENK
jgi:hypothetical protein